MSSNPKSKVPVDLNSVFLHLPPKELERYLLSRLDVDSLKAARCVSKLWQSLIDPCLEFQLELSDHTKNFVEAFGPSRQVTSLATTMFHGKYPENGIQIRTKMLRVTVDILDGNESFLEFQRLCDRRNNRLKKNIGLTEYNFRRVILDFQYVQKFHIASLAVKSFTNARHQLARVHLPNLKEIIITFFDGGFHQLLPFMKNYFPKLESVNIANVAGTRKDRPMLYSWIFGFVGRHRHTLSEVSLILPEGMVDDRGSIGGLLGGLVHGNRFSLVGGMSNIRSDLRSDLKTPPEVYKEVKTRLMNLTTLTKLIWDMSMLEGHRRYTLGHTLLFAQTQLVELHLDNLHLKDLTLWNRIGEVLKKLNATLESLSLGGCFCGPPTLLLGDHVFSCSWLKDCNRLKYLEMVICGISVDSIEDLPCSSLKTLNLGHMLIQDQIEYVACHMTSLETWVIPQRGSLVNILVPKVNRYMFEAILYLPKLTTLSLLSECTEKEQILQFVEGEEGIIRCCKHACLADAERNGNLNFHIKRDTFIREHSELEEFIQKNRVNPIENLNRDDIIEFFIRNIIAGRVMENEFGEDDEWDDEFFRLNVFAI